VGWLGALPCSEFPSNARIPPHIFSEAIMKSKVMSLDEPRNPRNPGTSARNNAYGSNAGRANLSYSGQGRISPWLPVALGAVTVLIVLRALSEDEKRSTTQRWLHAADRRINRWWPDVRDTAEDYGSRAKDYLPDYGSTRDWIYDMLPSKRRISNLFERGTDWLPDTGVSKRQLLSNFDWNNPPRWLRNVDLSSESKRRRFLKDLRRYGSRKRDDILSSLGWR
jgi:hypothetical protein